VYDSIYAADAESEECALWTADHAYYRAVRGFLSYVRYLGDL
jgi:predicted nucleic acid-binding protein